MFIIILLSSIISSILTIKTNKLSKYQKESDNIISKYYEVAEDIKTNYDEGITNDSINELKNKYPYISKELTKAYKDKKITKEEYNNILLKAGLNFSDKINNISFKIKKNTWYKNIIVILIITSYFTLLPLFDIDTIGKNILRITIKSDNKKLKYNQLLVRSLLNNGILILIVDTILLLITNNHITYSNIYTNLLTMQVLYYMINQIIILNRKDNKGIHDIISKTYVERR